MRRFIAALAALGLLAAGCSSDEPSADSSPTTPTSVAIEDEPAPLDDPTAAVDVDPLVDLAWLDDASNSYVLVDARAAAAYESAHIPGARNLPATVFNTADGDVPYQLGAADSAANAIGSAGMGPDDTIVLYDADGSLYAARVYYALTYYGHADIRIFDGGLTTWQADGRATDAGAPSAVDAVDYPERAVRSDLRLELPDVTAALELEVTTFADARTSSEYDGTLSLDTEFNGHIPGAGNVDYAQTIDDAGRFLPAAELQALYDAAGIGPESDVVTYCLVGARAAHTWFVLSELLDYPSVALYDGSWAEYGNTPGLDVET